MVKEAPTVLFLRKLLRHIRNLFNPRAFKELEDLIQRCATVSYKIKFNFCPFHSLFIR
jgi:hypothetical protein